MKQVRTPEELIQYVRLIRVNGKKLNAVGREHMLAECAFEGLKARSSGYVRAMPPTGPVEINPRIGMQDEWFEAPHG
jgi:hypothetical protein